MLTDIEAVLRRSRIEAEEKERVLRAYQSRARAAKEEATWRTRACPGCAQALKMRLSLDETLFICPGCSWTHKIPFLMDEGRPVGEPFIPGVTGKPRPTVVFGADGKIRNIR